MTGKIYVIKVIDKMAIKGQKLIDQINREIEIMYKLNHPHVIKLINHFEDDEKFYLIMPYASKGQLYSLLRRQVRFDQRTAAQYMREVIEAVRYIHSFSPKIIHRDIKPENLLLDDNYRVLLSDFGWSNFLDDDEFRKTFCGTPEYLSPEMVKKEGHNEMVDIWALGVLMFEFLAGYAPFAGNLQKELYNNIKKLKISWPVDFPPLAKNLITKILKLNPSERLSLDEILDIPTILNKENIALNNLKYDFNIGSQNRMIDELYEEMDGIEIKDLIKYPLKKIEENKDKTENNENKGKESITFKNILDDYYEIKQILNNKN
jgi:serine/threonine protein kinase